PPPATPKETDIPPNPKNLVGPKAAKTKKAPRPIKIAGQKIGRLRPTKGALSNTHKGPDQMQS
ncbi:MAG: hypothetical protein WCC62_24480, partial [Pseudomonas capeferrum]